MKKITDYITIKNFKSIRQAELQHCRRINLEALTLFNLPFARYANNKQLGQFNRVGNENELFFNGKTNINIAIQAGEDSFIPSCFKRRFPDYSMDRCNMDILKSKLQ